MDSSPILSRTSSSSSRKSNLTLDLSNIPPLIQPSPPSNTLLFTNLQDTDIFRAENLQTIRGLIEQSAPIHSWSPLKSFRRIVVSFLDEESAIKVRSVWDGEAVMGSNVRIYFGQNTPVTARDEHLALPDAGKLFFISPPPSPPHDWEMKLEDAPNKQVHAEDLAEALANLRHKQMGGLIGTPISPTDSAPGHTRSRSSTVIYQPDDANSPNLPAITVDDLYDEPMELSPMDQSPRPILAHTARPPVELLMADA